MNPSANPPSLESVQPALASNKEIPLRNNSLVHNNFLPLSDTLVMMINVSPNLKMKWPCIRVLMIPSMLIELLNEFIYYLIEINVFHYREKFNACYDSFMANISYQRKEFNIDNYLLFVLMNQIVVDFLKVRTNPELIQQVAICYNVIHRSTLSPEHVLFYYQTFLYNFEVTLKSDHALMIPLMNEIRLIAFLPRHMSQNQLRVVRENISRYDDARWNRLMANNFKFSNSTPDLALLRPIVSSNDKIIPPAISQLTNIEATQIAHQNSANSQYTMNFVDAAVPSNITGPLKSANEAATLNYNSSAAPIKKMKDNMVKMIKDNKNSEIKIPYYFTKNVRDVFEKFSKLLDEHSQFQSHSHDTCLQVLYMQMVLCFHKNEISTMLTIKEKFKLYMKVVDRINVLINQIRNSDTLGSFLELTNLLSWYNDMHLQCQDIMLRILQTSSDISTDISNDMTNLFVSAPNEDQHFTITINESNISKNSPITNAPLNSQINSNLNFVNADKTIENIPPPSYQSFQLLFDILIKNDRDLSTTYIPVVVGDLNDNLNNNVNNLNNSDINNLNVKNESIHKNEDIINDNVNNSDESDSFDVHSTNLTSAPYDEFTESTNDPGENQGCNEFTDLREVDSPLFAGEYNDTAENHGFTDLHGDTNVSNDLTDHHDNTRASNDRHGNTHDSHDLTDLHGDTNVSNDLTDLHGKTHVSHKRHGNIQSFHNYTDLHDNKLTNDYLNSLLSDLLTNNEITIETAIDSLIECGEEINTQKTSFLIRVLIERLCNCFENVLEIFNFYIFTQTPNFKNRIVNLDNISNRFKFPTYSRFNTFNSAPNRLLNFSNKLIDYYFNNNNTNNLNMSTNNNMYTNESIHNNMNKSDLNNNNTNDLNKSGVNNMNINNLNLSKTNKLVYVCSCREFSPLKLISSTFFINSRFTLFKKIAQMITIATKILYFFTINPNTVTQMSSFDRKYFVLLIEDVLNMLHRSELNKSAYNDNCKNNDDNFNVDCRDSGGISQFLSSEFLRQFSQNNSKLKLDFNQEILVYFYIMLVTLLNHSVVSNDNINDRISDSGITTLFHCLIHLLYCNNFPHCNVQFKLDDTNSVKQINSGFVIDVLCLSVISKTLVNNTTNIDCFHKLAVAGGGDKSCGCSSTMYKIGNQDFSECSSPVSFIIDRLIYWKLPKYTNNTNLPSIKFLYYEWIVILLYHLIYTEGHTLNKSSSANVIRSMQSNFLNYDLVEIYKHLCEIFYDIIQTNLLYLGVCARQHSLANSETKYVAITIKSIQLLHFFINLLRGSPCFNLLDIFVTRLGYLVANLSASFESSRESGPETLISNHFYYLFNTICKEYYALFR